MKIVSISAKNFGSYKEISLNDFNHGLTLVSGPTGSGKSTLCDLIPWILFGRTAKDGAADDVLKWGSDESTSGTIVLADNYGSRWSIHRQRNPNDLHINSEDAIRGKDLADTQKIINEWLGLSAETYLAGAYVHEFSQTAQFFTASAKSRRQIIDQLCDLSLNKRLSEQLSVAKRDAKASIEPMDINLRTIEEQIKYLTKTYENLCTKAEQWQFVQDAKLKDLTSKIMDFDINKANELSLIKADSDRFEAAQIRVINECKARIYKISSKIKSEAYFDDIKTHLEMLIADCVDEICANCGSPKEAAQRMALTEELHSVKLEIAKNNKLLSELKAENKAYDKVLSEINPHTKLMQIKQAETNGYIKQFESSQADINPYLSELTRAVEERRRSKDKYSSLKAEFDELLTKLHDIEILQEVNYEFRGLMAKNVVIELETRTNQMLTDYFDAEIKVAFSAKDADKLDVTITKDGNSAVYAQLSKGQRQLLKLCFGVAVMEIVANHHGQDFNCLWFDEALDGLDDSFKAKAFNLLQKLATTHENVFVVEHNESLKTMFTNEIRVIMNNGVSQIAGT